MSIAQQFLAEFEQEARLTRPFMERLTEANYAWRPHPKSMSAGQLALHVAAAPAGIIQMLSTDSAAPPTFAENPTPASRADLLAAFDASIQKVREILPTLDDAAMARDWSIVAGGKAVMTVPRAAAVRMILLSHIIQHRGQLTVYLRQLDIPVPSTYGPSADELPQFMQASA